MAGTLTTWGQTLCRYVALAALCVGVVASASASASVGGSANIPNSASSATSPDSANAAGNAATAPSATAPAAATLARTWSNLWWTPDQQGERLLQSDQPDEAAQRFSDPRRQAYAALRAGQYAQAAKLLAPFRDARSEYNRGNALAHTGRLQEALDAYDAALARAPRDRDARHNRDLVAQALRQSAQQHGQQGQQGDAHQQGGSQRGQQDGNNAQQRGNGQQRGGGQLAGGAQQPSGSGKQPQADGAQAPGNQSQSQSNVARAQSRGSQGQSGGAQAQASGRPSQAAAPSQGAAPPPVTGALARQGAANAAGTNGRSNALQALATPRTPTGPSAKPESEQALSLEQWLRQIPDDPGGLLRRKFLIEHLMRQRSADP